MILEVHSNLGHSVVSVGFADGYILSHIMKNAHDIFSIEESSSPKCSVCGLLPLSKITLISHILH